MMNLHTWTLRGDDIETFKEEVNILKDRGHDITVSYTDVFEIPEGFNNSGLKVMCAVLLATNEDNRRIKYVIG